MTNTPSPFPYARARRLRQNEAIRNLSREHRLSAHDLVLPIIIRAGDGLEEAIETLPGIHRYSPDTALKRAKQADALGIPMIMLFPYIEADLKTPDGQEALNSKSLIYETARLFKDNGIRALLACDIALDPYTNHGHDGLLTTDGKDIDNDKSLDVLTKQALIAVEAGFDVVAPSDMMDGRILAIREALEDNNHHNTLILSYAAKYASHFYGPYRDAVGSAKNLNNDAKGPVDKKTYQMDPANRGEALKEALSDVDEGADMVMVKPGMPYLDIIRDISGETSLPVLGYQVSGEYAMLAMAADKGCFDHRDALLESLLCFKRAGAHAIVCYGAIEIAQYLNQGKE